MVGASFDGSKTKVKGLTIRLSELALGAGYGDVYKRQSLYDRQLFRGDSLLAANYYKIKYDTTYISRPNARWTIKLREMCIRDSLKEDAMNNGQTKPAYNLQIATENQYWTNFDLYPNPTDTLTFTPFLDK